MEKFDYNQVFELKKPINQDKNYKKKGCPFASYSLRIVFRSNQTYEYLDRFTGELKKITSVPRYSKSFQETEPHPSKAIFALLKVLEENKHNLQKAELWYNLNRGFRINNWFNENKSKLSQSSYVNNILLHRFSNIQDFEAQKNNLPSWIYDLPTFQILDNPALETQSEKLEALKNYCDNLLHCAPIRVAREEIRTIYSFFYKNFIEL